MEFLHHKAGKLRSSIPPARRMAGWVMVIGFALVFVSALALVTTASAQPPADPAAAPSLQDTSGGKAIFEQMCIGCHTIGGGKLIGPDLKDVTRRREPQWIKKFIQDPGSMLDADPIAQQLLKEHNNVRMPNLGLSADKVDLLVAFLGNPGSAPIVPAAVAGGDAASGRLLFTGDKSLGNGGPPCMSCHTVSGVSGLGGGALGPDLTHVVQRLGEPGLGGALRTIAFPTMIGPFKNHALLDKEQADLVAFFKERDRRGGIVPIPAPGAVTWDALSVFAIGLAIAGLLFVVMAVLWMQMRKRYTPRLPIRKQ